MNTAARMESTSLRGHIQVSQQTADMLFAANKGHWLSARDEVVFAKGKGNLHTWFINSRKSDAMSSVPSDGSTGNTDIETESGLPVKSEDVDRKANRAKRTRREQQLIEWNANLLRASLKKVIEHRGEKSGMSDEICHQVTDFVAEIADHYNNNAFHSFEHASHVTMSVKKSKYI